MDNETRCSWLNLSNETYVKYHDDEWGRALHDDKSLYDLLIPECFQAGLSRECMCYPAKEPRCLSALQKS